MRAQVITSFGDPGAFQLTELPTPTVQTGEVLVRVEAASVNPIDTKLRQLGLPIGPDLPGILGCDAAGVVEAVGEGVASFHVGDRVYGCAGGVKGMGGTYAEYLATDPALLAHCPASLTTREAAALPLVTITAWEGLFDRAGVDDGHAVLVHGGTGGVGHVAIQLAKSRGAQVCAAVSSEAKAEIARELGADEIILYRDEPVAAYVDRLTGGEGFDVVYDATGKDRLPESFEAARINGHVITIVARYTVDLSIMHDRGLSLHAVFMLLPMLTGRGRADHGEIMRQTAELVDSGQLRPLIDPNTFTLDQVADAHRHLESGEAIGKIVIDVAT